MRNAFHFVDGQRRRRNYFLFTWERFLRQLCVKPVLHRGSTTRAIQAVDRTVFKVLGASRPPPLHYDCTAELLLSQHMESETNCRASGRIFGKKEDILLLS